MSPFVCVYLYKSVCIYFYMLYVCVRERDRQTDRQTEYVSACMCVDERVSTRTVYSSSHWHTRKSNVKYWWYRLWHLHIFARHFPAPPLSLSLSPTYSLSFSPRCLSPTFSFSFFLTKSQSLCMYLGISVCACRRVSLSVSMLFPFFIFLSFFSFLSFFLSFLFHVFFKFIR